MIELFSRDVHCLRYGWYESVWEINLEDLPI